MIPYKDDNPTEKFPFFTICLIVVNVAIFLFLKLQPELAYQQAVFEFGMVPYEVWKGINLPFSSYLSLLRRFDHSLALPAVAPVYYHPISPYISIFTSMFLHGGWAHMLGNMLYLWIFGNNVEDYLGHFRFLLLYIFWGTVAALTHLFANPLSMFPTVGASGAISGVLGAYLVLYPWARVHVLVPFFFYFFTTTIPAGALLVFWFLLQFLSANPFAKTGGAGVAYWAHIGGFIAGYLWMRLFRKKRPPRSYAFRTRRYRNFNRWI